MSSKPEECKICLETFDAIGKRPRILPCGHTFCSNCMDNLLAEGTVVCPNCRVVHKASGTDSFPVVFALEEFVINVCAEREKGNVPPTNPPWKGLSKKFASMRSEQEKSFLGVIATYEDMLSELICYKDKLNSWRQHHQELEKKMHDVIAVNAKAQHDLEMEMRALDELHQEGQGQEKRLKIAAKSLKDASAMPELMSVMDDTEECQALTEDWIQRCSESFPNVGIIRSSVQTREAIGKAMEMINHYSGIGTNPEACGSTVARGETVNDTRDSIVARVSNDEPSVLEEVVNCSVPILTKVDQLIRNLPSLQTVKELLVDGEVYARKEMEGGCRYARLSREGNSICIHHLRDAPPPISAHIIPYHAVASCKLPSAMAFLELARAGSSPERVFIRLEPGSNLGMQFLINCMGENGHSYASSCLSSEKYVLRGYNIYCKGYETKLENEEKVTRRPFIGDIWGRRTACCPSFGITLRNESGERNGIFGHVESGLDVLLSCWNTMYYGNPPEVVILDCGAVAML